MNLNESYSQDNDGAFLVVDKIEDKVKKWM